MKFNHIAALEDLKLPPDIQTAIAGHSRKPVDFPAIDPSDSEDEMALRTGDADAILVAWRKQITASYLDRCPKLKYIGVCATSLSGIDIEAVKKRHITLTNVTDYGDEATAEFIFMQLLMLVRGEGQYSWRGSASELNGKTLGIIGLGAIGEQVAQIALGFKMNVIYFSRTRKPAWEKLGVKYHTLPDLLKHSDIVSINVARDTRILNAPEFAAMRPGTILIDTAVGDVLDEAAFRVWVAQPGNFAIFDYSVGDAYFSAFKDLPNVTFPQVIAGHTAESKQRLGEKVLANLEDYLKHHTK